MICASTAARSASTAARPSTAATPGRRSHSKRRPSIAAARMTWRDVGIELREALPDRLADVVGHGRAERSRRSSSRRRPARGRRSPRARPAAPRRGTGCRRCCARSTRSPRRAPRRCRGTRRRSRARRPPGRASSPSTVMSSSRRRRASVSTTRSSGRVVQRHSSGSSAMASARYSTTPNVSASAQCRSSRIRRVACRPGEVGQPHDRLTEQHRRLVGATGRVAPPLRHELAEVATEPGEAGIVRR